MLESNSFKSQENDNIDFKQIESTSLSDNRLNTINNITAIENSS